MMRFLFASALTLGVPVIVDASDTHAPETHAHAAETHAHTTVEHKALPAQAAKYVDLPAGCLAKATFPCALKVTERGELDLQNAKLQAAPNAELRLAGAHEILILSGDWWIREAHGVRVKFGEIQLGLAGDSLIERSQEGLHIMNLEGQVKLTGPRKDTSVVPTGFQSVVAGLDHDARLVQLELRPGDTSRMLKRLFAIAGAGYQDVTLKASGYRSLQKEAVVAASKLYSSTLEARRLASESADKAKAEKQEVQKRDQQKYRQMFRDRFFREDGT